MQIEDTKQTETWASKAERAIRALPTEPFMSAWHHVSQADVTQYSLSIQDPDPIHIDPDWSRRNSPYPGSIAPGLWVASRLLSLLYETQVTKRLEATLGVSYALNYGYDRVRFVSPVPVEGRIRGTFRCLDATLRKDHEVSVRLEAIAEIEGSERPGVVANWILAFLDPTL